MIWFYLLLSFWSLMNKKYFSYTRISVKWQYDVSLTTQKKVLEKIAHENNIRKEDVILVSEEKSGKEKRVHFDRMIQLLQEDSKLPIHSREYGGVLFYKIDRLSRRLEDFYHIEELINKWYVFISATETIDSSPSWKLLLRLLSSLSLYESEKASTRKSISIVENIFEKQIGKIWWDIPFWYINKLKKIELDPKQYPIVQEIYQLYITHTNYEWVLEHLSKESVHILTQYQKKHTYKNILSLIESIILNNHSIQYDGTIQKNITLTNDIIVQHIEYLKEQHTVLINNTLSVGDVTTIEIFIHECMIIDNELYNLVQWISRLWKKKELPSLFHSILYLKTKKWVSDTYPKMIKWRYYYCSKDDQKYRVSEQKIVSSIEQSWILHWIENITDIEDQIINIFQSVGESYFMKEKQRLHLRKFFYEQRISALKTTTTRKNSTNLSTIQWLNTLLSKTMTQINDIDNKILQLQKEFLSLFTSDNFKKNDDRRQYSIKYEMIFEKIVIEWSYMTITLQPYLQSILWCKSKKIDL